MLSTYTTPAVYVKETSNLPPSVTAVATAIPAFIGYTEKAGPNNSFLNKAIRISSMLDYEAIFGGAPEMKSINISTDIDGLVNMITPTPNYYLYHSMQLFYANGGGPCYIVSVGLCDDTGTVDKDDLKGAFDILKKQDEPTIVLSPDSSRLINADYYDFTNAMIKHCGDMQDRFAVIDAYDGDQDYFEAAATYMESFRSGIASTAHIKYAAAYYPFVKTSISIHFSFDRIDSSIWTGKIQGAKANELYTQLGKAYLDIAEISDLVNKTETTTGNNFHWKEYYDEQETSDRAGATPVLTGRTDLFEELISQIDSLSISEDYDSDSLTKYNTDYVNGKTYDDTNWDDDNMKGHFYNALSTLESFYSYAKQRAKHLEDLLAQESSYFSYIRNEVQSHGVILPPSGAVAGIYASVDAQSGVWEAPANIGFSMVTAPVINLSHEDHGRLNVDPNSGKSINAIRSYNGLGILLMGDRTLMGNDPEWRYVNVRRLFIFIEESIQEASERFLFSPNNANTWAKMKGMINNFLYNLWRDGALAGAKPEDAYKIKVGLGESMTSDDILNGYLKVKIRVAAVRPAEFIELEFIQQLQTS